MPRPVSQLISEPKTRTRPKLPPTASAVIGTLAEDTHARVAFQALRRRLQLHPQVLARTLKRLEADGLVARSSDGYRVTGPGLEAVAPLVPSAPQYTSYPILYAALPPQVHIDEAANQLSRRWFAGFRWYGRSDVGTTSTLVWTSEDGRTSLRLRFCCGAVALDVTGPEPQPAAFGAARAILGALAELYTAPASPDGGPLVAM